MMRMPDAVRRLGIKMTLARAVGASERTYLLYSIAYSKSKCKGFEGFFAFLRWVFHSDRKSLMERRLRTRFTKSNRAEPQHVMSWTRQKKRCREKQNRLKLNCCTQSVERGTEYKPIVNVPCILSPERTALRRHALVWRRAFGSSAIPLNARAFDRFQWRGSPPIAGREA